MIPQVVRLARTLHYLGTMPNDNVTLTLPRELAQLVSASLRFAAEKAEERVAADPDAGWQGLDQPGQLRWTATYIDHKLADAALARNTADTNSGGSR